jgi:GAF domain
MLGVSGAGISLVTSAGNHGVVCATDDVASRVEDLQLTLGEGPCVDAVRTGGPVLVSDVGSADIGGAGRWPGFVGEASAAGIAAVFAFPLRIGSIAIGAMDLYRDRAGDLTPSRVRAGQTAADAAAHAVLELGLGRGPFADDQGLRSSYLMQVHQATGMIQVQLDVRTDEALLMLRARAFASGRTLVEVATDVVARRLRFSTED